VLYVVLSRDFGRQPAIGGVALLAFSPASFVFSMAYSESLFLVLAAAYFWTSPVRGRPLFAAAAMLTRITGIAVTAAALVSARKNDRRAAVSVVAGVIALACWWGYTAWLTGNPVAILTAGQWVNYSGLAGIANALQHPNLQADIRLAYVAIALAAATLLWRRSPELAAYSLAALALGVLAGSVASMPRYASMAFPAFALISAKLGRVGTVVAVVASASVEAWFIWLSLGAFVTVTP